MLTQDIKRKIDNARQILVGKVPDPKAQVEQITLALIYKFMDDMDKQAMSLPKGRAQFFTNGYEQYAWNKLMDPRLGGQERLDLYVRAITELGKNPHLPQLFRDIYKNAFLPFRDSATLNLFLKEINSFEYDHSENLGDAFEYLLSILGSQGEAGQFRTPRHIIDFIVSVVDPKKDETVLDPACGTAGFLISAYKHILAAHDGIDDPERKEKPLTPDERKKLMNNFAGYDISPDMVKLSLVNMYLHGFPHPNIHEYDTLTSEDRWDERFDVILANPPFMSPKGGIRPHKRFSVQANRSEVLFVDYIKEHLNPKGRAGIIVPEGIIFQSAGAYKQLRRLLVEDGLYAVVSLPGGVFNPYSGVKTSILFFDNELAKRTDEILFIKVLNDGFDLGAQRREIGDNDLPEAISTIHAFQKYVKEEDESNNLYIASYVKDKNQKTEGELWSFFKGNVTFVSKTFIAESGDYSLSGERYKESVVRTDQKWPMVELGDVCTFEYGKPLKDENRKGGEYPVFGSNGIVGWHNEYLVKGPMIIVGRKGTAGAVTFSEKSGYPIDTTFYVQLKDASKIDQKFLYSILRQVGLDEVNTQAGVPGLNRNDAYKIKIPLPPLEIQKEIVEQIEVKQNAIDHAKAIIKNLETERQYFGQDAKGIIDIEWVELGDICEITSSKRVFESEWKNSGVPFYRAREIVKLSEQGFVDNELYISEEMYKDYSKKYGLPKDGDLMVTGVGTLGICYQVNKDDKFYFKDGNIIWLKDFDKQINSTFLKHLFRSDIVKSQIKAFAVGGTVGTYTITNAKKTKIPLPSLEIQKQMVVEAEKEEEIIIANKKLIELMEGKISDVLNSV